MKALMAVATLVLGLAVYAPLPAAAEEKRAEKGASLAERLQDLNVTDEQEAKIADTRKEFQPKIQEAGKKLAGIVKEEVEKVRDVLTAEQKEKLQALKEEREERGLEGLAERIAHLKDLDLTEDELGKIQDIRKEYRPRIVKALQGFKAILTDEQKKLLRL